MGNCSCLVFPERTISRWIKRAPRDPEPAKRWLAFLRNHREAIAAMDFFTVPTITFGVLYCFFVISHDRRRTLHVIIVTIGLPDPRVELPTLGGKSILIYLCGGALRWRFRRRLAFGGQFLKEGSKFRVTCFHFTPIVSRFRFWRATGATPERAASLWAGEFVCVPGPEGIPVFG